MKRAIELFDITELCYYGCGNIGKYRNGAGHIMCCEHNNKCPANRKKNSSGLKNCGRDYSDRYENMSDESKSRMGSTKGLTKNDLPSLARPSLVGKRFGASLHGHSEETKKKLSKLQTEWLRDPAHRKNLGRYKKSWMELTFENYLNTNNIFGWEAEKHFWNDDLKKNYFTDFIFEDKKIIIELDGSQHKNTIEQDAIRDLWFSRLGYQVLRINHFDFKNRYFSGNGFLDLLGG